MVGKHIGLELLLSLPPAPPAIPLGDLAEELYPDEWSTGGDGVQSTLRNRVSTLVNNMGYRGWRVRRYKKGILLDRPHYQILREFARSCRPDEPRWNKRVPLTPDLIGTKILQESRKP